MSTAAAAIHGDATPLAIGSLVQRGTPAATASSYEAFAAWAAGSLELVRPQLMAVAFPLFAYTALHLAAHVGTAPYDVLSFFEKNATAFAQGWERELPALRIFLSNPTGSRDASLQQLRVGWTRPLAVLPARRGATSVAVSEPDTATVSAAAGLGDADIISRLLDSTYRVPVTLTPLALELLVEYLSRSGAALLLTTLNERVAVSMNDDSVRSIIAGESAPPAKVRLPLPLHDVAPGILRTMDERGHSIRWGVRAPSASGAADVQPPVLPALGGGGGGAAGGAPGTGGGTITPRECLLGGGLRAPVLRRHCTS